MLAYAAPVYLGAYLYYSAMCGPVPTVQARGDAARELTKQIIINSPFTRSRYYNKFICYRP